MAYPLMMSSSSILSLVLIFIELDTPSKLNNHSILNASTGLLFADESALYPTVKEVIIKSNKVGMMNMSELNSILYA